MHSLISKYVKGTLSYSFYYYLLMDWWRNTTIEVLPIFPVILTCGQSLSKWVNNLCH